MDRPHRVYEALPYADVGAGLGAATASYLWRESAWSNLAFVAGTAGIVGGCVILLRRRSYRDDAARYDHRPLDE